MVDHKLKLGRSQNLNHANCVQAASRARQMGSLKVGSAFSTVCPKSLTQTLTQINSEKPDKATVCCVKDKQVTVAHLQSEIWHNMSFILSNNFPYEKSSEIVPEIVESLFCGSEKVLPSYFLQHFLAKYQKSSATSFSRSAGKTNRWWGQCSGRCRP